MKTLKFRAWEFEANEFIYLDPKEGFDTVWLLDDEQSVCQQFTGLKDKNGKEIYEGDILNTSGNEGVVFPYYVKECLPFIELVDKNGNDFDNGDYYQGLNIQSHQWGDFEVIGNIYENQELLNNK